MTYMRSRELRSKLTSDGTLELRIEEVQLADPAADEIVVRMDAAPLNPADMLVLLGPADPSRIGVNWADGLPVASAAVDLASLPAHAARLDQSLPVGSEGAGLVVRAGSEAHHLLGKTVALRSPLGTFAQYRLAKAGECLILPDGVAASDGASAFINPLTVLGMVETMRREGHVAIVHTAAASNVGQMLHRLCMQDHIPLVNIVRNETQVALLKHMGARYVLDSTSATFERELVDALIETHATLAFDAIGGGTMAGTILRAMETALTRQAASYSRYGSPVHKQVYLYGVLDPGPRIIAGNLGAAWGVSGWLMTWFYEKIDPASARRLRERVVAELTSTFASTYTARISLEDLLEPRIITAYSRRATGQKFLVCPQQ